MTASQNETSTSWFAVWALFLCGLCAAMQFAKAAPVMKQLGDELKLSLTISGFAVSALGIVGILLAISAGSIAGAVGLRRGLLAGMFGGGVIAFAGAWATGGVSFLASRVGEGLSHLIIVVCAPALMAMAAASRDKPLVLSLWGCFFGLGFAIASFAAPFIVPALGWRGLFMIHAVLMMVAGALVAWAMSRAGLPEERHARPNIGTILMAHLETLRSGAPLVLALTFCAYTILFLAMLTFLGRFLVDAAGWSKAATGTFLSLSSLASLVFTLASGFMAKHGVSHFAGTTTAFLVVSATSLILFLIPLSPIPAAIVILVMMSGFGMLPGFAFATVPAVAGTAQLAALTYGAIAMFGNVGTFLGTPLFAMAFGQLGWAGVAGCVVTASLLGIALAFGLKHQM